MSPEEDAGIEAALESYREGRVVDAARVRAIIDAYYQRRPDEPVILRIYHQTRRPISR